MGGEKPKSDQTEKGENYETTVIDFLDQEITASAAEGQNNAPDELDAIVSNLLKEVITESNEQNPSAETEVKVPVAPVPAPTISASTQHRPGSAVLQRDKSPDVETKTVAGRVPAAVFSQIRPAPSKRGLVISVALVCLLASIGFGIYRLAARQPAVSVERQPVPAVPVTAGQNAAMPGQRDSKTETQPLMAQPIGVAQGRGTSAAVGSAKPSSPAAPLKAAASAPAQSSRDLGKETKNPPAAPSTSGNVKSDLQALSSKPTGETTQPREVSTATSPAAVVAPPPAPAGKPAQPTVPAVENPAGTRQPEKVDNAPSAPPVSGAAEPKPAQPGPGATNRVDSAPSSNPPPAAPSALNVVPAVAISKVNPIYPEWARRMHIKGTVVLDLSIDGNGKVTRANVVSGDAVLAVAAIDAGKRWQYKPALINGKSVATVARVSFVFQ